MKLFVVSDVHSFYYNLREALDNKGWEENNPSHVLLCCGDLFDRGEQPKELLEFVQNLTDKGRFLYVRGNHEDLLKDCLTEISHGYTPSNHHFHNKTVETICRFCEDNEWIIYDPSQRTRIIETMSPILEWIDDNSYDCIEIGDYIFVHGWVPVDDGPTLFRFASKDAWRYARWTNGMNMWKNPSNRIEGKTIVCGHWHCSYGWSHIRQERKEWPPKNRKDWKKSFEPFIDQGIMAIDGCTAYSGIVNCEVIEFEGDTKYELLY